MRPTTGCLAELLQLMVPTAARLDGTSVRERGKRFAIRPGAECTVAGVRLDHGEPAPGERRVDALFVVADEQGLLVIQVELKGVDAQHAESQHRATRQRLCAEERGGGVLHSALAPRLQRLDGVYRGRHAMLALTVSRTCLSQHQARKKRRHRSGELVVRSTRPRKQPYTASELRSLLP